MLTFWDGRDGPFPVLLHHKPAPLVKPGKDLSNQKGLLLRGTRGPRESALLYLPCGYMPYRERNEWARMWGEMGSAHHPSCLLPVLGLPIFLSWGLPQDVHFAVDNYVL